MKRSHCGQSNHTASNKESLKYSLGDFRAAVDLHKRLIKPPKLQNLSI